LAPNDVNPPLTVKVLLPLTVVAPLRLRPPEPDWTVVLEVLVVLPRVTLWALAPVPILRATPLAESTVGTVMAAKVGLEVVAMS
jgi:hypothetical protein